MAETTVWDQQTNNPDRTMTGESQYRKVQSNISGITMYKQNTSWVMWLASNGKDLGVVETTEMKTRKHCTETVKPANKLVRFIGRTFQFKSEKEILAF